MNSDVIGRANVYADYKSAYKQKVRKWKSPVWSVDILNSLFSLVVHDSRQQLLLVLGQTECILMFNSFVIFLTPFWLSLCQEKNAAMWFSLLFTRLLAHTARGRQISYSSFTQLHRVRCKYGNLSRSLSFLTFWVSLIPKIKSGTLCQAWAVNFSTMTGCTGRWEDVRKMFDAHISIRPDRCTVLHISQLPLRV